MKYKIRKEHGVAVSITAEWQQGKKKRAVVQQISGLPGNHADANAMLVDLRSRAIAKMPFSKDVARLLGGTS